MINQFEVPMYLEEMLPDISTDLKNTNNPSNVYQSVHVLLDYTFRKITEHNLKAVKTCFKLAAKLYDKGNTLVKCALENVFVFSLSHLPEENKEERKKIMGLMPGSLYTVYIKQVMHAGV